MRRLNFPHDLFNLFTTEQVLASELVEGDIACLHGRWSFVLSSTLEKGNNSTHNQAIKLMPSHGTAFYPPANVIDIIPRNLIDKEKVRQMIIQNALEEAESEKWRKEEEEEEKERLREMRDQLNRELGED